MTRILGLDIGIASVGWALIEEDVQQRAHGIIACGSRIFETCVDDKTGVPLNQARRNKRLLRRQIARRRQRRDLVRGILVRAGLMPADLGTDPDGQAAAWNGLGDPYRLRAEGLERRLDPAELARVFLALARRRGFQSNRKADKPKDDEDRTDTDQGMADLRDAIAASGCRTLGEYQWKHGHRSASGLHVRNRLGERRTWAERAMLKVEFDRLWDVQAPQHPGILTDALKNALFRAIFWQRPLKAPARAMDGCAFEPAKTVMIRRRDTATGQTTAVPGAITIPRAAWAWPVMQRVRYWQRINDLTWRDPQTMVEHPLTSEQKAQLAAKLDDAVSMSWGAIRKLLKLRNAQCKMNLELATDEKGLKGNSTVCRLRERLDDDWDGLDALVSRQGSDRLKRAAARFHADAMAFAAKHGLPTPTLAETTQDLLVTDLLTIDENPTAATDPLLRRLQEDWGFTQQEALAIAKVELDRRPGRFSLKAARRLLPPLRAGRNLNDAAASVGYKRVDEQRRNAVKNLNAPPRLRNPVVNRALSEVRRVVNAILAKHGPVDGIRVELAREATMTPDEKRASESERKFLEKSNAEADDWWRAQVPGRTPDRTDRIAYRLWKRQGGRCLYTDRAIAGHQLVDGSVQIDHVLPYSRTLDDSFGNKVLVFADANQAKGNRTPREWLSQEDHAALMARARTMTDLGGGTLKRLLAETTEVDAFHQRALNDTRWITREVLAYLGRLFDSHDEGGAMRVRVEAPRGNSTAALRHRWGLGGVLGGGAGKNRADHRHHALDAIVIACTNRRIYRLAAESFTHRQRTLDVDEPWPTFRDDVRKALDGIIVSHAVDRRIRGALHDDSAFGLIRAKAADPIFVSRRRIETLSTAQIGRIVDPSVRTLVAAAVATHGDAKKAAQAGITHADGTTPIHRVRVDAGLKRGSLWAARRKDREYRFHELASNHRLEVLRQSDGSTGIRLVRMLDHARATRIWERAKARSQDPLAALPDALKPLKDGTAGALVMALHKGDAVRVDGTIIGRVDKLSTGNEGKSPDIFLRIHTDAAEAKDAERIRISNLKALIARVQPIAVTVLGEVRDDHPHRGSGQSGPPVPG